MRILQQVCSIPTAPFVEHGVIQYVERFVAGRRRLRLTRDSSGNLLIELPGRNRKLPRWIFGAHIDHPGLVARRMIDAKTLEADFRGFVLADLMSGVRVRFFDGDDEIVGRIIEATKDEENGRKERAAVVRVRVPREVPPGSAGMFDLTPGKITGRLFHCRAIDDVAGAAAALSMIDRLHAQAAKAPQVTVGVLLTRAEEEGFIGAMGACVRPELLRKTDRIIAIETSAVQPYAPQGKGPIIRVGDRTSTFNSSLTYFLTERAEEMKKKSKGKFDYQRALMPGGTCEATVYDIYGYEASSICVALGNYHNMDRKRGKIAAEFIDVHDWKGMVDLFVAVARNAHEYEPGLASLRMRLEKRFFSMRPLLKDALGKVARPSIRV